VTRHPSLLPAGIAVPGVDHPSQLPMTETTFALLLGWYQTVRPHGLSATVAPSPVELEWQPSAPAARATPSRNGTAEVRRACLPTRSV